MDPRAGVFQGVSRLTKWECRETVRKWGVDVDHIVPQFWTRVQTARNGSLCASLAFYFVWLVWPLTSSRHPPPSRASGGASWPYSPISTVWPFLRGELPVGRTRSRDEGRRKGPRSQPPPRKARSFARCDSWWWSADVPPESDLFNTYLHNLWYYLHTRLLHNMP